MREHRLASDDDQFLVHDGRCSLEYVDECCSVH